MKTKLFTYLPIFALLLLPLICLENTANTGIQKIIQFNIYFVLLIILEQQIFKFSPKFLVANKIFTLLGVIFITLYSQYQDNFTSALVIFVVIFYIHIQPYILLTIILNEEIPKHFMSINSNLVNDLIIIFAVFQLLFWLILYIRSKNIEII